MVDLAESIEGDDTDPIVEYQRAYTILLFLMRAPHGRWKYAQSGITYAGGGNRWHSRHDLYSVRFYGVPLMRESEVGDWMDHLGAIVIDGESIIERKHDRDATTGRITTFFRLRHTRAILRELIIEHAGSLRMPGFLETQYIVEDVDMFNDIIDEVVSDLWPEAKLSLWATDTKQITEIKVLLYYLFANGCSHYIYTYYRNPEKYQLLKRELERQKKTQFPRQLLAAKKITPDGVLLARALSRSMTDQFADELSFINKLRAFVGEQERVYEYALLSNSKAKRDRHLKELCLHHTEVVNVLDGLEVAIIAKILTTTKQKTQTEAKASKR